MNVFAVVTIILGFISFILLCLSTGTPNWKEDIDVYKGTRVHIGLWRACFESEGKEFVGYPVQPKKCDKAFLRPHLVHPPAWFNSVRALMLLSCIGTGFGIFFYFVAIITDNSKKTGSKYWPSALILFAGGLCALIALSVFTVNTKSSVQFELAGGRFFASYWTEVEDVAIVQQNKYKIETWLRWSYIVGWGGVAFNFFSLISAVLSDLIRKVY